MRSNSNEMLRVCFALAAVALVACVLGLAFSDIRLVATFVQLSFTFMTIGLLARFQRRQHRVTQELLEKISQLAEEMKQERKASRAPSLLQFPRIPNPNGRN